MGASYIFNQGILGVNEKFMNPISNLSNNFDKSINSHLNSHVNKYDFSFEETKEIITMQLSFLNKKEAYLKDQYSDNEVFNSWSASTKMIIGSKYLSFLKKLGFVEGKVNTVIGNTPLRVVIGANTLRAITTTNQRFTLITVSRRGSFFLSIFQTRSE